MPRRRPPTMAMRTALAALAVATSRTDDGRHSALAAAASTAAAVLDWDRYEIALGIEGTQIHLSADMPPGWLLHHRIDRWTDRILVADVTIRQLVAPLIGNHGVVGALPVLDRLRALRPGCHRLDTFLADDPDAALARLLGGDCPTFRL